MLLIPKDHTGSLENRSLKINRSLKANRRYSSMPKNSQYLTADIRTNNVVLRMTRVHRKSGRRRCILLGTQDNLNMLSNKHYMKNTQNK